MAIFIASTKSISRGKGQSAVASASYRAGVELEDQRYGKTHDYSKRHGVMSADIILPSALAKTRVLIGRNDLWNMAETAEKRKDARVGREWLINLPHELDEITRKELAHTFAQALADRYNTIADCAIHRPTNKEIKRGADPRNYHAHIMFTTRQAALNSQGEIKLTEKATVELSDNKRRELGLKRVSNEIKVVRQLWEDIANTKLAEYGYDLIDSSSYKNTGVDIVPQIKLGKNATQMKRNGITTHDELRNIEIAKHNTLTLNVQLADNKQVNSKADQVISNKRKANEDEIIRRVDQANKYSEITSGRIGTIRRRVASSKRKIDEYQLETSEINIRMSNHDAQQGRTNNLIANNLKPKAASDDSIRRRIIETQRRAHDTEQKILQTNRDIERITAKRDNVVRQRAYEIGQRFLTTYYQLHYPGILKPTEDNISKRLDDRQNQALDSFSKLYNLSDEEYSSEFRKKLVDFFTVPENAIKHKDFTEMLIDPVTERKKYDEMHQNTPQHIKDTLLDNNNQEDSKIDRNNLSTAYQPRM